MEVQSYKAMRLAAFTLIEIVIALAVLSIVTALTYKGFSYLAGGTTSYIQDSQQHMELMGFASRFEADLARAERLESPAPQQLMVLNYDGSEILYQLRSGYLFRAGETITDSVPASAMELNLLSGQDSIDSGLVETINLETALFDSKQQFFFFKQYHAAQYLERP